MSAWQTLLIGVGILKSGGSALDAVELTVAALEDDPCFNAGMSITRLSCILLLMGQSSLTLLMSFIELEAMYIFL